MKEQLGFELSGEQKDILEAVESNDKIIGIEAVAGSSKSTTIKAIGINEPHKSIKYIVFSKEQQREAQTNFPNNIEPSTIHSLAYQIVKQHFKISIGFLSYRNITGRFRYEQKLVIIDLFSKFCTSYELSIDEFFNTNEQAKNAPYAKKQVKSLLKQMMDGSLPFTHDAYLKLASIIMHSNLSTPTQTDLLVLDESNDASGATIRLFELYPAKQKLFLGDRAQTIFKFLNLHSSFDHYENIAKFLPLSTTFRCSITIAEKVQDFMQSYYKQNFKFIGVSEPSSKIESTIYISRFNASLVDKILEFAQLGVSYNLTRHPDRLFSLSKDLAYASKNNQRISDAEFKYIEEDIEEYYANYDALKADFPNLMKYLFDIYQEDKTIANTIKNVGRVGKSGIIAAYESAMENWHRKERSNITLSSCHASKGTTYDKVFIMDDLNEKVLESMMNIEFNKQTQEDEDNILLGYVACTRARFKIENCEFIDFDETTQLLID